MKEIGFKIRMYKYLFVTLLAFFYSSSLFCQEKDFYIEVQKNPIDSSYGYNIFENNVISTSVGGLKKDNHDICLHSNGEIHGPCLTFKNGFLHDATIFREGIPYGTQIHLSDDGKPQFILNRDSLGKLHGLLYEFNEFGELSLIFNYHHGKMIGLIYNGRNKGYAPPPVDLSYQDSLAWRLKLDRNLIESK